MEFWKTFAHTHTHSVTKTNALSTQIGLTQTTGKKKKTVRIQFVGITYDFFSFGIIFPRKDTHSGFRNGRFVVVQITIVGMDTFLFSGFYHLHHFFIHKFQTRQRELLVFCRPLSDVPLIVGVVKQKGKKQEEISQITDGIELANFLWNELIVVVNPRNGGSAGFSWFCSSSSNTIRRKGD